MNFTAALFLTSKYKLHIFPALEICKLCLNRIISHILCQDMHMSSGLNIKWPSAFPSLYLFCAQGNTFHDIFNGIGSTDLMYTHISQTSSRMTSIHNFGTDFIYHNPNGVIFSAVIAWTEGTHLAAECRRKPREGKMTKSAWLQWVSLR